LSYDPTSRLTSLSSARLDTTCLNSFVNAPYNFQLPLGVESYLFMALNLHKAYLKNYQQSYYWRCKRL